jgi:hypothetical protein
MRAMARWFESKCLRPSFRLVKAESKLGGVPKSTAIISPLRRGNANAAVS